jgi:hypothetical protein
MHAIAHVVNDLRARSRAERANVFRTNFHLDPDSRVLHYGSGDGSAIAAVLQGAGVPPGNVYIADSRPELVAKGQALYGFSPVVVPESGPLPFEDAFFDVVYCAALVPGAKSASAGEERGGPPSGDPENDVRQTQLAEEIRRLGRSYFVQAPNRWFPIESQTWLPFGSYLPRRLLIPLVKLLREPRLAIRSDRRWLTATQMRRLFPDARIVRERVLGMTKSIIAIKGLK